MCPGPTLRRDKMTPLGMGQWVESLVQSSFCGPHLMNGVAISLSVCLGECV